MEVGEFPHPTQMSVMPVVAVKDNHIRPVGTCFAISNHGLVLTARHVIDDALELTNGQLTDDEQWIGAVYAAKPTPEDETTDLVGGILPATKVHSIPSLDIAAMHLNLPRNIKTSKSLRIPLHGLGVGLPVVGESCFGLGYHSMDWEPANDGVHTHKAMQSYSASRGEIRQIHVPKRDSRTLSFPCFEVSARYDLGMSGGPVINEIGSVIGVICSSFGEPDEQGHISYASLIGSGLFLVIDADVGNGVVEKRFLYDFVIGGSVVADDTINSLKVQRHEDKLRIQFDDNFSMSNDLTA